MLFGLQLSITRSLTTRVTLYTRCLINTRGRVFIRVGWNQACVAFEIVFLIDDIMEIFLIFFLQDRRILLILIKVNSGQLIQSLLNVDMKYWDCYYNFLNVSYKFC